MPRKSSSLSPKVIASIVIAIIIVIGIIGFDLLKKNFGNRSANEDNSQNSSGNKQLVIDLSIGKNLGSGDTDGDGLLDWEEGLRKTDPNNPDTDGDGTNDGDEVLLRRDPTIPGPDDSVDLLNGTDSAGNKNSNVNYTEGTLSDQFATNFISNYFRLGSNGSLDEETKEGLSEELVTKSIETAKIPNKYSASDIKTFPNYEKEKIKEYGNVFAQTFVAYFVTLGSIEDKNYDSKTYINLISTLFGNLGDDLSKLPVPIGLLDTHLNFINNLNRVKSSLKALNTADQDPVRALFAFNEYEAVGKEQPILFGQIADYFEANDIIFNEEEAGIMWNNF